MRLDKTSVKILKYVKGTEVYGTEELLNITTDKNLADACLTSLVKKKLITNSETTIRESIFPPPNDLEQINVSVSPYKITPSGLAFLEVLEEEQPQTIRGKFSKWIRNNVLELIAIIISIIALLKP